MLSREVMGLVALAILWVNTLLVMGAAGSELGKLRARLRRLLPLTGTGEGLLRGRVRSGAGAAGELAIHQVEQVGRYAADDADHRAIAFADGKYGGVLLGGVVDTDAGPVQIEAAADAEVWPLRAAQLRAAACRSTADFESAWGDARKARGFARTVATALLPGTEVFLQGTLRRDERGELHLAAASDGSLLVAGVDPRALCRRKVMLVAAFLVCTLAAASICTVLALHAPAFGTISTLGAALGLAYFLLIQPAGTAMRDAARVPSAAILRGSWLEGVIADSAALGPDASAKRAA